MSLYRVALLSLIVCLAIADNPRDTESKENPGLNIYIKSAFFTGLQ